MIGLQSLRLSGVLSLLCPFVASSMLILFGPFPVLFSLDYTCPCDHSSFSALTYYGLLSYICDICEARFTRDLACPLDHIGYTKDYIYLLVITYVKGSYERDGEGRER